jgi:hypothetical protein
MTWLYTNSYLLRYIRQLGRLLRLDEDTVGLIRRDSGVSRGFLGKTTEAQDVHFAAAAKDAAQWLQPYGIRAENLDGLVQIAGQNEKGNQVIVIEMPVSQEYFDYFENGQEDYERFADQVGATLSSQGTVFLRTVPADLIPSEGWWDRSHMNLIGANIFSQWLAAKIVGLVAEGRLEPPTKTTVVRGVGK